VGLGFHARRGSPRRWGSRGDGVEEERRELVGEGEEVGDALSAPVLLDSAHSGQGLQNR
jgi:hypothetical protein